MNLKYVILSALSIASILVGVVFWMQKPTKAEYPAGLVEEAKNNPNGWVYEIDPKYDPHGAVPPEGIKGGWKVNEEGKLTGEFKANPNYIPEGIK